MSLHVVFSFDENDNPPLADLFNVFVKANVGHDISSTAYQAFLKEVLEANRKYVSIQTLIRTDRLHESVDIEDILFIEVFHHTLFIHCINKTIKAPGTLTEMEERLRDYGFIRTNRHYLVPFNKIRQISHDEIIMQNENMLHIGKTYQKKIRAMIREKSS